MKETVSQDWLFILSAGMIVFIILTVGAVLICAATLRRVKGIKNYCDTRFDKITELINEHNRNTTKLTDQIKQLNTNMNKA